MKTLHISCSIDTCDLPDTYVYPQLQTYSPRPTDIHIRQITSVCVITVTYMYNSTGCPCLISLTFSGEILVHSLPSLRPVAVIPYSPLHDYRYVYTCININIKLATPVPCHYAISSGCHCTSKHIIVVIYHLR